MIQAIGVTLGLAVAVALSPFPVIGVVLILASPHARRNGPLFALGWVVGLAAITTVGVLLFGGADDPDSTSSAIADWGRVLGGAAMMGLGVRKWWTRPRSGEAAKVPAWMDSIGRASAGRALALGLLLSGANPKNVALAGSAAAAMVEVGVDGNDLVIAVVVFVLVGSCTVLGALGAHCFGGPAGATFLDAVRRFMTANSTVIMVVILVVIGASILGGGLNGLGR